jgi:hypothetical protein
MKMYGCSGATGTKIYSVINELNELNQENIAKHCSKNIHNNNKNVMKRLLLKSIDKAINLIDLFLDKSFDISSQRDCR